MATKPIDIENAKIAVLKVLKDFKKSGLKYEEVMSLLTVPYKKGRPVYATDKGYGIHGKHAVDLALSFLAAHDGHVMQEEHESSQRKQVPYFITTKGLRHINYILAHPKEPVVESEIDPIEKEIASALKELPEFRDTSPKRLQYAAHVLAEKMAKKRGID